MVRTPAPFKSPSAVLQQHENPQHAAHQAAVAAADAGLDLNKDPAIGVYGSKDTGAAQAGSNGKPSV
jgi:hypothetical protein